MRGRQVIHSLILALVITIFIAIIIFIDAPKDFEGYVRSSGYAGVLLMGIVGSTSPIWPLPGSWAAFIAGGLGLNPFLLALAAGFGEPVGELTAYTAGYGGQVAITKWKRYSQVERWVKRYCGPTIFLVSAIPNNLTKVAVVAAGALCYPWYKFLAICWAGKTIKSFGFALAGAGLFTAMGGLIGHIF